MAKKPIRVFRRSDGRVESQAPVGPKPELVYKDATDRDRLAITQQVYDMPDAYKSRSDELARSRYNDLLHSIYDALLITDVDGNVLEVNARAEHKFIWTENELLTMNILDIISGSDEKLLALVRGNASKGKFTVLEAICKTADDARFYGEIVVNGIFRSKGNLAFFIRDVTVRKQAEEELNAANERLVEAEKIQARVDTLSTLYHELNNPLQILTCMAEIDKNEEYKKQLGRVVSVLEKLRKQESFEVVRTTDGGTKYDIPVERHIEPCDYTRLLIAEDEKVLRDMFVNALSLKFPSLLIEGVANGQEAVRLFAEKRHALIIMDVSMPVLNGEEAFVSIKAECEKRAWMLPSFIFCTGFLVSENLAQIVGDGSVHACLEKPLTMVSLLAAVSSRLRLETSSPPA